MPPECAAPPSAVTHDPQRAWPTHAFIISLPSKLQAFHDRATFLDTFGIKLERWPAVNGSATWSEEDYGTVQDTETGEEVRTWFDRSRNVTTHKGRQDGFLTLGERGYLESMRRLFAHALKHEEIRSMLVVDEDVVFDCDLQAKLLDVLSNGRCGGLLSRDAKAGGVLLLGASIWVEGTGPTPRGWALTTMDLAHTRETLDPNPRCFNAHSKVFGSFATLYHRSTFSAIYTWIKTSRRPYDHIYQHLSTRHVPVRVAFPFVAIQDVAHESTIDNRGAKQADLMARAKLHRWQLDRYCRPDFTSMLQSPVEA